MDNTGSSRPNTTSQLHDNNFEHSVAETDGSFDDQVWESDEPIFQQVPPSQSTSRYRPEEAGTHDSSQFPPSRPLVERRSASASCVQATSSSSSEHHPIQATFESPLRSILISGTTTSSVSVNTALASLSAAPNSSTSSTFAALANAGVRRAPSKPSDSVTSLPIAGSSSHPPMIASEKDPDDPDANPGLLADDGRSLNTAVSLSRLFAADDSLTPAPISRGPSHVRSLSGSGRTLQDTSSLSGHLFHHGFLEGRHSDITVYAFGEAYKLHRILLDRVPFFSSAFSGGWAESTAREMVVHPEDIDSNITKTAFELAIKRIYGTSFPVQEEQVATGLFATACWLNMPDLVESCVDNILQQMQASTLHGLIKLVTNNYYGRAGDRILSSAKAMLCRDGWEMPYSAWDNIPSEIIREIIGGDPFFIPSEWERWFLSTKILNRKLKTKAIEAGLVSEDGQLLYAKPSSLRFFAIRFDTVYRRESGLASTRYVAEKDELWVSLYTSPEISPLLVLLDEGIHYAHLRFEQLQQIRSHRDILGVPVLPEKVISDALWSSMILRQKVLNAHEHDLELGLTESADNTDEETETDIPQPPRSSKGKEVEVETESRPPEVEIESDSWDGNGKPRKFWIPSNDISVIMGGTREANVSGSTIGGAEWNVQAARLSASLEPADVTWATDFVADGGRPLSGSISNPASPRYSRFPPYRFAVELPSPRTLKEKKRVYSHTVFYLGSLWNLYVQRVHTSKNQQLGVYLHRAKENSPSDDPLAQVTPASVDDRIGQLEREMLLRKTERHNRGWQSSEGDNGGESGFGMRTMSNIDERTFIGESGIAQKDEGPEQIRSTLASPDLGHSSSRSGGSGHARLRESDAEDEELLRANRRLQIPTMPPYLDRRPVIKTYFKIYSPDKNGRLLSIYESAPEKFVVSKSWGWKSSQTAYEENGSAGYDLGRANGKLRYMVVIGNV